MSLWHWHPSVALGLAGLLAAYLTAARSLGRRGRRAGADHARAASPAQTMAFVSGLAALAAVLLGPVAEWAEHVALSAHMTQHLVLTLVVPPLWLAGLPGAFFRPLARVRVGWRVGFALTRPAMALALASATLVAWHLPVLFEAALRREALHILEHGTLLATALLLWWPVLGPLPDWPRPAPAAQLLYLFLCTVPMMAVASPITLADHVLYPFYGETARPWPLSPRTDQELAGIVMWIGGTLTYAVAGTIVFFRWAAREEPAEREAAALPASPRSVSE